MRLSSLHVPAVASNRVSPTFGTCKDESRIRKVDTINEDYILKEGGAVLNWFDIEEKEGRFSLNDRISHIISTLHGKLWFARFTLQLKKKMRVGKENGKKTKAAGFEVGADMMRMMGNFTVLRLTSLVSMMNISFTGEELLKINRQLNRIRKPKAKKHCKSSGMHHSINK